MFKLMHQQRVNLQITIAGWKPELVYPIKDMNNYLGSCKFIMPQSEESQIQ